jgi:multidrug efflux pump subunit AcrA (membrane-fusion protein)
LLPGMTATVNIVVEEQRDVILVPSAAISYARSQGAVAPRASPTTGGTGAAEGTPAVVLILRDGEAVPTPIRTGSSDEQNTVVLSGLEPGEQVIVGAQTTTTTTTGTSLFGGPGGRPGGGAPQQKPGGAGGGAAKPGGGG